MNLLRIIEDRIKKQVLSFGASEKEWRVLVIDGDTAKLLHHSLPMSEVLAMNIATIERIEEERKEPSQFAGIYFLNLDEKKAKAIEKESTREIYKKIHVVSLAECSAKSRKVLDAVASKIEKKRKKAPQAEFEFGYKSVVFDFVPLAADVLLVPESYSYYRQREKYLASIAQKLKRISESLGLEFTPVPVGRRAAELAGALEGSGKSKLVVLERGTDPNSALIHFFSFESLLWDIGLAGPGYVRETPGFRGQKNEGTESVPGKESEKKQEESEETDSAEESDENKLEIGEQNTVWVAVRNLMLVDAHQVLANMIKQESSASKEASGNIKKLAKTVQELPAQTKKLREIKILMGLLEESVEYFNHNAVRAVAELEQEMATGKSESGKALSRPPLRGFHSVLQTCKLTKREKLRLFLLLVLNYGPLSREDEKKVLDTGHISKKDAETAKKIADIMAGRSIRPRTKGSLPLARYTPAVREVLTAVIKKDGKLCKHYGISTAEAEEKISGGSLRKREFVFRPSGRAEKRAVLVYFIGGVCISEITEAREIAKNTGVPIFICSTNVCSPNDLMDTWA